MRVTRTTSTKVAPKAWGVQVDSGGEGCLTFLYRLLFRWFIGLSVTTRGACFTEKEPSVGGVPFAVFRLKFQTEVFRFFSTPHLEDRAQRLLVVVIDLERSLVVLHGLAHVAEAVAMELYVSTMIWSLEWIHGTSCLIAASSGSDCGLHDRGASSPSYPKKAVVGELLLANP